MFKRVLSALLASMMLLPMLAACGDTDAGRQTIQTTETTAAIGEVTTAPVETEPPETKFDPFANFPADLKYDGKTFTIHNANTGTWYTHMSVVADEQTGDIIHDSIYTRQLKVEERFGIEIVEVAGTSAANEIRTAVQANTQDYDMTFINLMGGMALAAEGLFLNFKTDVPGVRLDQPWWDQKAIEDMSINHKLFYVTGAADITRLDGIRTVYYNKEMAKEFELGNLYELVDNGTWTIDKYAEFCQKVKADLDGNGVADENDRYGAVAYGELLIDTLVAGCGFKYIAKDQNDLLISNIDSEVFYNCYETIRHIMHEEDIFYDTRVKKIAAGDRAAEQLFLGGHALFYSECMAMTRVLREMEADFGVLLPPKRDEQQDRYYIITLNPWCMAVLNNTRDPEFTGNILEALNAASYDTVVPAYVDITLTGKVARDPDSIRMLELIFDNLYYNIHISDIVTRQTIQDALRGNSTSIVSTLTAIQKLVKRSLPKTNAKFTDGR